jgi:hypothetical protein
MPVKDRPDTIREKDDVIINRGSSTVECRFAKILFSIIIDSD